MKILQGFTNPNVEGFAFLLLNGVPQIVSFFCQSMTTSFLMSSMCRTG